MEHIDSRIEQYKQRLSNIRINADASPYELRVLEKDLDDLQTDMLFDFSEMRTQYQDIQRSIEVITRINIQGSNEQERRANGYNAARGVQTQGSNGEDVQLNLFEVESVLRRRYFILQDIFSAIRDKSQRIITLRSTLKIEEELTMN